MELIDTYRKILEGDITNKVEGAEKTFHYKRFDVISLGTPTMFTKKTKGENWEFARKGVAPSFSYSNLYKSLPTLHDTVNELLDKIDSHLKSNEPCNIRELMVAVTFDFITTSMFGVNFHALTGLGAKIFCTQMKIITQILFERVNLIPRQEL